eukprot:JZ548778.1.p3 GENE.JZ548778.1~~JZ548778.1.p3  ORF type:complete len:84 (-),score=3.95 JZ548778.1:249-500(-)
MHEIAIAATIASALLKLTASRFAEIRHRRELSHDWTTFIPPSKQCFDTLGRSILVLVNDIYATGEVVAHVTAHSDLLDDAILG